MINFAQFGNDLYTGRRSIDFVQRRKTWYGFSAVLIAIALAGILLNGLNFGIEFRGGMEFRVLGVTNTQNYEAKAQEAIGEAGIPGTVTATVVGANTVRVQTETAQDKTDAARTTLAKTFDVGRETVSSTLIGPSWGAAVSEQALRGLIVFLVLVTLVMALYFRTWKMALAGLTALLHDLLITVGIYSLFGFEITPSSMIGFLTILGYSLYDTVVVFDKVRENTAEAFRTKRMTYNQAANLAVNQTLVRSINTTVVALLPIAAILFVGFTMLGPGTLLDLSLALFIGIGVGAYSSIFIATPMLVQLRQKEPAVVDLERYVARHTAKRGAVDERSAPGVLPAGEPVSVGADGVGEPVAPGPVPSAARPVHKYVQAGPRNQPRRPPKSKR
ncbi:protein translocase subunit SecF [Intrasporangium calvum]|uniref:Protein-export membrane protein SecF n=1 Tax=Intrasporangium calvum (strain ATCC 23552 / DSM 43043 / JCM 3097 / NBRC 12989 / NCIMB 10167 / NRRL B-3866 / 7 KIP) TaxID=710696 RepID=E6SB76_INTC7|nr:protein translocase subunit SecF [Intrasporangium calvum]ADU48364.1 protein translocase subunit secF [Intrasporangium calvum DSM 43043]